MKRIVAMLLLLTMVISFGVGCSKPEEQPAGSLDFEGTPGEETPAAPGAEETPAVSPEPGINDEPDVTVDPSATIDPNATPGASPSPAPTTSVDVVHPSEATAAPEKGAPKSYSEARKINKDVVGWIKVPNTNINYPILYDKNFKYDKHDINGEKANAGTIYSYWTNTTRNFVVTGHNMRKAGTMFHDLHKIQDNKSSLTSKSNRTFTIQIPNAYEQTKWEVFALYETKDSESSSTRKYNTQHLSENDGTDAARKKTQEWIDTQKKKSEVKLDVNPTPDDMFMTLVTCGDNYDYSTAESRLYIFLRAVE